MFDKIDPSRTLEIAASQARTFRQLLLGILLTLIAALLLAYEGDGAPPIAWFAAIIFGGFTFFVLWRLVTMERGPVVTISPRGIRDIRLAAEFLPWTAVRNISSHAKMMVLTVDPAAVARLTLSPAARTAHAAGPKTFYIRAADLDTDFDRLLMMCAIYAETAKQGKDFAPKS